MSWMHEPIATPITDPALIQQKQNITTVPSKIVIVRPPKPGASVKTRKKQRQNPFYSGAPKRPKPFNILVPLHQIKTKPKKGKLFTF